MFRNSLKAIVLVAVLPVVAHFVLPTLIKDEETSRFADLLQFSEQYVAELDKLGSLAGDTLASAAKWGKDSTQQALSVEQVTIEGNSVVEQDQIFDQATKVAGQWLWDVDTEQLAEQAQKNPWVQSARARFSGFPASVIVELMEKKPIAVAELDGSSWLVSEKGELIQELRGVSDISIIEQSLDLPRLSGFDKLKANSSFSLQSSFQYLANFITELERVGGLPFAIERFDLGESGEVVVFPREPEHPRVRFATVENKKSLKELISKVDKVLNDIEQRGETVQELDLRFDNQIVAR